MRPRRKGSKRVRRRRVDERRGVVRSCGGVSGGAYVMGWEGRTISRVSTMRCVPAMGRPVGREA
jgi:hypothetical protein